MKRVMLVIGLVLVAGVLFAAGPKGGAGHGPRYGAGDLDQTREQLQLKDGSCQDDPIPTVAEDDQGDRDQLQLKDGSCDGVPTQDKDRTQLSKPDK